MLVGHSGLFRLLLVEGSVHLVGTDADGRVAGFVQILLFGAVPIIPG